ncbi:hypothetical protein GYMLUDRAFT_232575 [Collybiopsis luxurians FD-317 M1]|uniref:Major facilitator superfamily (MFS) profile domain-containing protein n=1 Tax=Collybiopsis luxurians FD-317 M1 TaxID=944289 RepID=A0A0D0C7D6_9AGAR|nr:hypothetical protein GYMLUDRAFT_232575 [Collybiopsis luxurians FD-317 M1]
MQSLSSITGWKNNTHKVWWKDPGLRDNVLSVALLYFSWASVGYTEAAMNSLQALPFWNEAFANPSGIRLGILVACIFLGQFASAPFIHLIMDRFGRKAAIAFGSWGTIAGAIITTFSQNQAMFIAGRVIIGASVRFATVGAMVLVSELIHPRLRGQVTHFAVHVRISAAFFMASYCAGAPLAAWVSFFCLHWHSNWQWRLVLLLQVVAPIASLIGLIFPPESPRWLIQRGKRDEALKILANYHANGDTEDELVQREFHEIVEHVQRDKDADNTCWKNVLRTSGNRYRMLVVTLAVCGSLILGSGIARNYFTIVLKAVGIKDPSRITATNGGLGIWNMVTTAAGAMLVDKAGRRPMYLWTTLGMLTSLCVITGLSAAFEHQTSDIQSAIIPIAIIVLFFIFIGFHQAGWNALYSLYIVEILPLSIRSKGMSWANVIDALMLLYTSFVDPIALQAIQWKYYLVYIGIDIIFLGLVWMLFLETRGGTIEQASLVFDRVNGINSREKGPEVEVKNGTTLTE